MPANLLKKLTEVLGITQPVATLPPSVQDLLNEADGILTQGESMEATRGLVCAAIKTKLGLADDDWGLWLRDLYGPDQAIYEYDGKSYQISYSLAATNGSSEVTLGEPKEVQVAYIPVGEAKKTTLRTDVVALIEAKSKSIGADGATLIKLIAPVEGSSGKYTPEVLERDGPTAFPAGLQMFVNHQTESESAERPEGDLRDLAAVTTSAAKYEADGLAGPGLYAEAKVLEQWRPFIEEVAPYTGVSIRADGLIDGNGVITEISHGHSVDFVTKPGADGKVVSLFESAYKRVAKPKEDDMSEAKVKELEEAAAKHAKDLEEANAKIARMENAQTLREANEIAAARLRTTDLPDFVQERLVPQVAAKVPLKEGAIDREAYEKAIDEAATKEAEYLSRLGGGRITGMGPSEPAEGDATKVDESLAISFAALGLSESGVKVAVAGR